MRAYTVVLVGYEADDPPMRYLLEALEADRERYPDLQRVFAFASFEAGNEEMVTALWQAKGVEPILYRSDDNDHGALYETLRETRDSCRKGKSPMSTAVEYRRVAWHYLELAEATSSSLLKNLESGAFSAFFPGLRVGRSGVFACWRQFLALCADAGYAATSLGMRIRL